MAPDSLAMPDSFSFPGVVARWLAAVLLVLATYNPSGYSYIHWIIGWTSGNWTVKILVGILLAILYATFILATYRSLGALGIAIWTVFFATFVWLMIDIGLIEQLTLGTTVTLALIVLANVFAIGLSWSYIRARLSGQADTNDVTLP